MRIHVLAVALTGALAAAAVAAESVDVNEASVEELMARDGVGEVLARRIVDYRESHDGFASVGELQEVDGIGARTLEDLKGEVEAGS